MEEEADGSRLISITKEGMTVFDRPRSPTKANVTTCYFFRDDGVIL
jgi:hypothetical protein